MSNVDRIVSECVDTTLSSFEFVEKGAFYVILEQHYGIKPQTIAKNYEVFHKALKNTFGRHHASIERQIVKTLHERTKRGIYKQSDEIKAFNRIVTVFMKDSETRIKEMEKLTDIENYAKNLEIRVEEATAKLKDAERMAAIGETAAMVGHDIRNPLQAIVNELYLAKEDVTTVPDEDIKKNLSESITAIEENLRYIDKIVTDLQNYARPLNPVKGKINATKAIEESLFIVTIPGNIQVSTVVPEDFPMLTADASMLKRAIVNLVQNAVQAMPQGGKLTIKASIRRNEAIISVEDTGVGIPDEAKPKIFTPMFTTKSKGQGFGLAVVKRLVEAQGGTVTFESEVGKGTKFIIKLPN